jgi:MSHA biogenesis protein MshN
MSLINQVLKDLDERRSAEYSVHKTELDDLHFAHTPKPSGKVRPVVLLSSLAVVAIAAALAGWYFYDQYTATGIEPVASSQSSEAKLKPVASKQPTTSKTETIAARVESTRPVSEQPAVIESKPATVSKVASPLKSDRQTVSAIKEPHSGRGIEVDQAPADSSEAVEDTTPVEFTRHVVPMRSEQKAELAYQDGYDHLRAQRHRQAEQALRQALAQQASHIKARELLSGVYIKQGRWIEASELLKEGLSVSPSHITFAKLYARALMQLNRDQQAIRVLEQHAPAMQSDPSYFAILAALHQRQSQHQQAADVYARLVGINPQNGVWWVGLGISLEALNRSQDATRAYQHARKTGNLHQEVAKFTNNRLLALDEINFPAH